jgi:hypothetical protein
MSLKWRLSLEGSVYDDVVIIYIGTHDFAPGAKIKSQYLSEPINNMFRRLIYID